jgi:hypothetical protein
VISSGKWIGGERYEIINDLDFDMSANDQFIRYEQILQDPAGKF